MGHTISTSSASLVNANFKYEPCHKIYIILVHKHTSLEISTEDLD